MVCEEVGSVRVLARGERERERESFIYTRQAFYHRAIAHTLNFWFKNREVSQARWSTPFPALRR